MTTNMTLPRLFTAADVISRIDIGDFTLRYCQFLDDFIRSSDKEKLIIEEPPLSPDYSAEQYALLAAAVHFLSDKENLTVPKWAFKKRYYLPLPTFPLSYQNEDHERLLKDTTPSQFGERNLMYGANVCQRA